MQTIQLTDQNQTVLFSGLYRSIQEGVEDALANHVNLDGINLAHTDLRDINLDGINLRNGNFQGANLSGANLTEASFYDCDFSQAELFNTCFALSTLQDCTFLDSACGATDLRDCIINDCSFSGPSALLLPFSYVQNLDGCVYVHETATCQMTCVPLVIMGLSERVALFDNTLLINDTTYPCIELCWHNNETITAFQGKPISGKVYKAIQALAALREAR